MKSLARPSDSEEIRRRLTRLQPDSPRRWGRMTAQQMLCHLSDGCDMALGERAVADRANLLRRTFVRWLALSLPLSWPRGVETVPEIDQTLHGTPPAGFAEDRARLERLLRRMTDETARFAPSHPIFGPMAAGDWRRWGYLHADHHLRQFGV